MNKLALTTRAAILRCLTDGMSIRATSRVTGASKGAILRLLAEVGEFAEGYSYWRVRELNTKVVEADEQWSYVGAKAANARQAGHGDLWTFVALDADTKLVVSWLVGAQNHENAAEFVADLAGRCRNRIQLSTDGHGMYLGAVRKAFDFARCDYGRIVKVYGQSHEQGPSRRYSPPVVVDTIKERMIGRPDMDRVSTSYVERLNLNTRQNCRRFTRLTNGFSKKAEAHSHAVALQFFAHNFCRAHGTLSKAAGAKTTPAMAAGLTDHVWGWEEVLTLADASAMTVT